MGFFDDAYDEMSFKEVSFRLPSELAISSIKRRVNNTESAVEFINSAPKAFEFKEVKDIVNSVMVSDGFKGFFDAFKEKEATLFKWVSKDNRANLIENHFSDIPLKLAFNMVDKNDADKMKLLFNMIIRDPESVKAQMRAIIDKASVSLKMELIDAVVKSSRDDLKIGVLETSFDKWEELVDNRTIHLCLKSLASHAIKNDFDVNFVPINALSFSSFDKLKPMERLASLKAYLKAVDAVKRPSGSKIKPFKEDITEEQIENALFAGSVNENDLVTEIKGLFSSIVDPKKEEKADEP